MKKLATRLLVTPKRYWSGLGLSNSRYLFLLIQFSCEANDNKHSVVTRRSDNSYGLSIAHRRGEIYYSSMASGKWSIGQSIHCNVLVTTEGRYLNARNAYSLLHVTIFSLNFILHSRKNLQFQQPNIMPNDLWNVCALVWMIFHHLISLVPLAHPNSFLLWKYGKVKLYSSCCIYKLS